MGLWSFLRKLWPWRKRPQPASAVLADTAEALAPGRLDAPAAEAAREALVPDLPPPAEAAPQSQPAPEPPQDAEPPSAGVEQPVPPPAEVDAPPTALVEADDAEEATAADGQAAAADADDAATADQAADAEEEEDDDAGWEDEEDLDLDEPDPFISGALAEDESVDADLEARRAAAREAALAGEQRIYFSMPAGPGSLAEALNQLSAEGLVEAEFVDGDGEPHIVYRPLKAALSEPE